VSASVAALPDARQDILDAREFFERCRAGLGAAFTAEVLAALDRTATMPELYGEVGPGIRAAGVKRFGYVVYYRIGPGGVEVLAVLHGGRDSRTWQSRVST
jgi:plasmid stabilization system protein ParE